MLVGISVKCTVCGLTKKPHGRSAPTEMANGLCDDDCPGYNKPPMPGCLWPGETEAQIGFPICDHATEQSMTPEPRVTPSVEYQKCTPEHPMPKGDPGFWTHAGAKCTGECADSCCDYYECVDCGHRWKVEVGQ
jgi:hypothetical protein